jgi:hypothetical protein
LARAQRAAVIARLDRATQYAVPLAINLHAPEYWVPAFAGMTAVLWLVGTSPDRALARSGAFAHAAIAAVIARLDRATQYAVPLAINLHASEYWIPAFAGMTRGALLSSPGLTGRPSTRCRSR